MNDSLRTRLVAALRPTHNGRDAEKCADAVIRELKLHVVTVGYFQTVIQGSYPTPLEDK